MEAKLRLAKWTIHLKAEKITLPIYEIIDVADCQLEDYFFLKPDGASDFHEGYVALCESQLEEIFIFLTFRLSSSRPPRRTANVTGERTSLWCLMPGTSQ